MKNIFTYIFRLSAAIAISCPLLCAAQQKNDSTWLKRTVPDSSQQKMNMDAVYNRPFLNMGKMPLAIGGYVEANSHYSVTDGISDGFSFQARRTTLFFSSTVAKKIKFLAELEFEDGVKEINLETALVDFELHSLLNFRGGILMNPIGAFNQNHDGPRWDFVDRPLSATTILPATLSNAGCGFHGKYNKRNWTLGYELYLTNGFSDDIIDNSQNRTSLAEGKSDPERFEENFSGVPMFTGKLAIRNRKYAEIGVSYMHGIYNKFMDDGIRLDHKRSVKAYAIDWSTALLDNRISICGEWALVRVDVPVTYSQSYGTAQSGLFTDLVVNVFRGKILHWEKSRINAGCRFDYADYNLGRFRETGDPIGDEVWSLMPSLAFRPAGSTVLRLNYRYMFQTDLLGNLPSRTATIQFGLSTYF